MKNQRGFAAIEAVLLLVLLVAFCFVGYRYYTARNAKPVSESTTKAGKQKFYTHTRKNAGGYRLTDCESGKRKYTSTFEGVSFSFPCDWRIKVIPYEFKPIGTPRSVVLISPTGSALYYEDLLGQSGHYGYRATYTSVERLPDANAKLPIYLVEIDGEYALIGNSDTPMPQKGGVLEGNFPYVDSKVALTKELEKSGVSSRVVSFTGPSAGPDNQAVKAVLRSFKYE